MALIFVKHITDFLSLNSVRHNIDIEHRVKVKPMEKYFLVWGKKYKNINEVPEYVSIDKIQHARTKCRIRATNYMIVAGLLGSILMVYTGKRAAKKGDSVEKMNRDWHKQYNEENKDK